jgi:hypothetical protein
MLSSIRSRTPPPWCPFISDPCHFDLALNCVYPSCSIIQENIIFNSANDRSSLEFEKVLDSGTWESHFPFRASARVAGPRISSNKVQTSRVMKHNPIPQGAMLLLHGRKKMHEKPKSFLLSMVPRSSFLHGKSTFHRFLCPSSFTNPRTRFLLGGGGGCNTSCYGFPNHLH